MLLISVKHSTKSWLSKNMHKLSIILMLYSNIASSISCCCIHTFYRTLCMWHFKRWH